MSSDSRKSILLIDDDAHLRLSLRDFLANRGYRLVVAESAEEGIEKFRQETPDLILLDISMPGIGGTGFLKQMATGALPRCPVIVLSARTETKGFFESLEVEAFLPKPCDGNVLLEQVQRTLSSNARTVALNADGTVVMVAENDSIVSAGLKTQLEDNGFVVKIVRTGPQVLEEAPRVRPAIIVLREFLPGMNGTVLAPLLAAMPSTKRSPVIIYDDSGWLKKKHDHFTSEFRGVARWVPSTEPSKILSAVLELAGGASV